MNSLVSIIITSYNSESVIERCIASIINQTYSNIEIIMSDDASEDQTLIVAKRILQNQSNWTLIENKVNFGGPARGRNQGLKAAKGDFICFCDADDAWLPDKLEKQVKYLDSSQLDFCGTNCENIGIPNFFSHVGQVLWRQELRRNRFPLSSLIIKEKVLANKIHFNEAKEFQGVEDYDFVLQLFSKRFNGGVLEERLVNYYYSSQSLSHQNKIQHEKRRIIVLRRHRMPNLFMSCYKFWIILLLKIRIIKWSLM